MALCCVGMPYATLTLEYFFDRDYDEADGGTGEDGHGFTTRLSYAF